jgi:hypothetical protein
MFGKGKPKLTCAKLVEVFNIDRCNFGGPKVEEKENNDWILNDDIGIESIYGYRLTEKEADQWVLEKCKRELFLQESSILPFEKEVYINRSEFKDNTGNIRKRAKAKGYYKEGKETNNLPIFAYIEVYDNIESSSVW